MCAMMPMLRTLLRSVRTSSATVSFSHVGSGRRVAPAGGCVCPCPGWVPSDGHPRRSPAVVRERSVGLGHLVGVLALLDRGAEAVRGVEDLVHEALGHGLLAALPRVADQPAQ